MYRRMVFGLLLALVPSVASAQTAQENYLPTKSQLYLRWDGMQGHRAAYDKTAAGQMMKGDTGKFLGELWKYVQEQLQSVAANEPRVGPFLKDVGKIINTMHNNGVVFGLQVDSALPPVVQGVCGVSQGRRRIGRPHSADPEDRGRDQNGNQELQSGQTPRPSS